MSIKLVSDWITYPNGFRIFTIEIYNSNTLFGVSIMVLGIGIEIVYEKLEGVGK